MFFDSIKKILIFLFVFEYFFLLLYNDSSAIWFLSLTVSLSTWLFSPPPFLFLVANFCNSLLILMHILFLFCFPIPGNFSYLCSFCLFNFYLIFSLFLDDWYLMFGNFTKIFLGVLTLTYDAVLMFQHYVLYRKNTIEVCWIGAAYKYACTTECLII